MIRHINLMLVAVLICFPVFSLTGEESSKELPQEEQPAPEEVEESAPEEVEESAPEEVEESAPEEVETAEVEKQQNEPVAEVPAEQPPAAIIEEIEDEQGLEEKDFWKGEIANIGSREIISPYNSAGISIGMRMIDERYYLNLNPKLSLRFDSIGMIMGFHLPLNIELFNTDITRQSEAFTFRTEDYDEWQDFLKIIRYIQVGGTEDKFHFSIGSNFAQSIGHGTIVRRYIPNNDSTFSTLSTRLNWYSDFGGFEALFGDVGRGNMFGGLGFVKPLGFMDHYFPKSISMGYVFFADRNAPTNLEYVRYYDMPDPNLNGEDWDRINETLYANQRVRRIQHDSKNRPVITDTEFLHLQGLSFELKSAKTDHIDIKHYFDYSWFKNDMSNGGFTKGILGRFNLDDKKVHAMRTQLEFRVHRDTYLPSFFDTFYDVERVEMMTNIFGRDNFTPDGRSKYWHLQNHGTGEWNFSFYGELSYSMKSWIALSFGYEQLPHSFSIFTHLELPDLWIFKGMLSYSKRGIRSFNEIFKDDNVSSIFRAVTRVQLLPILYLNGYIGKHWTFWNADKPRPNDNLTGHYVSMWDWGFDFEIGYEWGRKRSADKKGKGENSNKSEEKKDILDY